MTAAFNIQVPEGLPSAPGRRQWGALLRHGERVLSDAGIAFPERAARWILSDIVEADAARLLAFPEKEASILQAQVFGQALARCQRQEPLEYVLGYTEFCGLRIRVTPDVMIPRPETELLAQKVLERIDGIPRARVLDLGTGSGCISLAVKEARPDVEVLACDISRAALQVARENAAVLGLGVSFFHADMLAPAPALPAACDLIVSNPPYVPDEEFSTLPVTVRDFEPVLALSCGLDPMRFYHAIAAFRRCLQPDGCLLLEVHENYAVQVTQLMKEHQFSTVKLYNDLSGRPRIVAAAGTASPDLL